MWYLRMTTAIPASEREKIVKAYNDGLGTIVELANIFNITSRTVSKYLKQYRETGDLEPRPRSGRPRIIDDGILQTIRKIVLSKPDGTLEDHRSKLYKETGIDVTIVTIFNCCKKLKLRRKKKFFCN